MRRVSHYIEYLFVLLAMAFSRALSPRGRVLAGNLFGRAIYHIFPYGRRIVTGNISLAYPEWSPARIKALALANLAFTGRMALEFLSLGSMTREEIVALMPLEGVDIFEKARSGGNGVLLLTAHNGNWEYLAMRLSALGVPLNAIGKRIHNPFVDRIVAKLRIHAGMNVIPHREAARPALRALKRNEIVAVMTDQAARKKEWAPSTFFGKPAATNQALAILALRSGAPVLYVHCHTQGEGYVARFEGPIEPPPDTGDRDARVIEYTRIFDKVLEASIREHPAEWFWLHRRWKLPKGFKSA